MMDLNTTPVKKRILRLRKRSGKYVLIDGYTAVGLNATSYHILKLVDGKHTIAEIVDDLSSMYDVDRSVLERDCVAFLSEMEKKGIIELSGP